MKKQLNPTLTYVLSIVGLLCCCFGGLGFLLSGPAYLIANSKIKDAQLNPDNYEGDTKSMNTAKIVALVILIINVLYFILSIYQIYNMGGWEAYMEKINEVMQQAQQAQ